MKQELVFTAKLPLPEDYFEGITKTTAARQIVADMEGKISEAVGEPVRFSATVQPWKDPNAKPRGRAAQKANAAAATPGAPAVEQPASTAPVVQQPAKK